MLPIEYSEYELETTAKVVAEMNDSFSSAEEVKQMMLSMIDLYGQKTASFSTGGFQLTFFKSQDGEGIHCRFSVSSYLVLNYIEKVKNPNKDIRTPAALRIGKPELLKDVI